MHRSFYLIVIFLSPLPVLQHFIWPLSYCLLADICNHTWIPECGGENITVYGTPYYDKRMFIDECDLFEFNCDHKRNFEIINYTECFTAIACPTHNPKFYRIGNYRFLEDRRMIYDPTHVHKEVPVPSLPMNMLQGKRRYTPEKTRRFFHTRTPRITTRKMITTTKSSGTIVFKRLTVVKNGRLMVKVVRGFLNTEGVVTKDSDFLE